MKKLRENWGDFLTITLSPWFLIFCLTTVALLVLSVIYKDDTLVSNLLAILGSITGGFAGGIFQNEHGKLSGQNILEKKGQSAVRNLMSLQKQIHSLRAWVAGFSKSCTKDDKHQLDEIDRHLSTIELNLDSGYEDWIDIIPQLRQEKEIHEKYGEVFRSYAIELWDQRLKLAQSANATEREVLEKKISSLEKQMKDWKKERREVFVSALGGGTSNPLSAGGLMASGTQFGYTHGFPMYSPFCNQCGAPLDSNIIMSPSVADPGLCENCSKKKYGTGKK